MSFYCKKDGISVMAILNITPDSFFAGSRCNSSKDIISQAEKAIANGADILDIGAVSTRPNSSYVSAEEELRRLLPALEIIQGRFPNVPISIDTYRACIAKECCQHFDISIINDVTGGEDPAMFDILPQLNTTYILSHLQGSLATMQQHTTYNNLIEDIHHFFAEKLDLLHSKGVSSIILDPGFGFSKTTEQNYELLSNLRRLCDFSLPLLAGISRKSMIYKPLGITPEEALNGTSALHMLALEQGASLIRVHDVREAKQVVTLFNLYKQCFQA